MNKGGFVKFCGVLCRYLLHVKRYAVVTHPALKIARPLLKAIPFVPLLTAMSPSQKERILKMADDFYDKGDFLELHKFLSDQASKDDAEILWRLARATYETSKTVSSQQDKLQLLEEALQLVTKALDVDPNCWAGHKWRAILLDSVWRHKSTKERILQSYEIRKHIEKAIELNPKDSTSYYLLGEWCYTFAELPWYQRKAASVLFASPPNSSFEEALTFFEKAEQNEPGFYSKNLLMLAKCFLRLDNKEKAVKHLNMVLDYTRKTSDDEEALVEAKNLLKQLGVNN